MLKTLTFGLVSATLLACSVNAENTQKIMEIGHLRLKNNLDRPQDGYCLDIVGSGNHIRFDMPLTAHNCKPGLYEDEAVSIHEKQYIYFPYHQKCATAAGLNGRALSGAAVIPQDCLKDSDFFIAKPLQTFVFHDNGQIELKGSGLCLNAGTQSDSTFSDEHRWRSLFLTECSSAEPAYSEWYFSGKEKISASKE
ncbi:hypothetical protein [Stenoxybacter acetivorans]|uniref:hypothetical protein n=1 Tax=Stenoxybacter acetivorans TaxID=422441 RepID=UPI000689831B|nr:hypothetical protein [Stenoxybacter acetivorans]